MSCPSRSWKNLFATHLSFHLKCQVDFFILFATKPLVVVVNDRKISDAEPKNFASVYSQKFLVRCTPAFCAKLLACRSGQHVTCINAVFMPQLGPKILPLLEPPMNVILQPKTVQQFVLLPVFWMLLSLHLLLLLLLLPLLALQLKLLSCQLWPSRTIF